MRNSASVILRTLPNARKMSRFQGLTHCQNVEGEGGRWDMMMKITMETVLVPMAPPVLVVLLGPPEALQPSPMLQALCLEPALPLRTAPDTYTHRVLL